MMIEPHPAASQGPRPWAFALLLAVFAGCLVFILPSYHAYFFGDEHFYTDSAIRMLQTGEYLTPVYADGAPRFNKPVLSYWMLLSSFRAFGISVLSSRLPSLLSGVLALALTGLLTDRLFRNRTAAFLAMLTLAANTSFITASMRATPDIFLVLTSLLSLHGFAGLLLEERPGPADSWCAYLGAGLAMAAKGMLGGLLIAFAFLFALSRRNRAILIRRLFCPAPMLAGAVLALGWFVAVYLKYEDAAIRGFLQDQVGTRLESSPGQTLSNLFAYTVGLFTPFLPASLLLAVWAAADRRNVRAMEHAPAFLFILAWYVILLAVFTPANLTRTRYLLPAFPLLAAGIGRLLLSALDHGTVRKTARILLAALAWGLVPAAGLLVWLGYLWEQPRAWCAAAAWALLAAGLGAGVRRAGGLRLAALLAAAMFGVVWSSHLWIRPLFPSTPGYGLARTLERKGIRRVYYPRQDNMPREQWDRYKEKFASHVRILSGGTVRVDRLDLDRYLAENRRLPIICAAPELGLFPADRFRAVRGGAEFKGFRLNEAPELLFAPNPRKAFRKYLMRYYVMIPVHSQRSP